MPDRNLWLKLAVVWLSAATIAGLLLWVDLHRAPLFMLVPYPSWRLIVPQVVQLFIDRPLMAIALAVIPTSALVATLVLTVGAIRSRTAS